MTRGTWREARTQGDSICRNIEATEDAASRHVTPVRRPVQLSGQAPRCRFPGVLEIVASGLWFAARFEDALAPSTVAAFKAILPFDDRIIHCRWSGESNWIPWG